MRFAQMQQAWLARPALHPCRHWWRTASPSHSDLQPTRLNQEPLPRLTRRRCTQAGRVSTVIVMAFGCATTNHVSMPAQVALQQAGLYLTISLTSAEEKPL